MEQLKMAHDQLVEILDFEAEELPLALQHTRQVETAFKRANPHEFAKTAASSSSPLSQASHPLLKGINIAPANLAAIEDLVSSIHSSQTEKDLASLVASGKGPFVLLVPHRSVEEQVALKRHRCCALNNINLLAHISVPMWKTWANLSEAEVTGLKNSAIYNTGHLKDPQDIPNAFPLSRFDHNKCSSVEVKVHTKQDLSTCHSRGIKHSSAL